MKSDYQWRVIIEIRNNFSPVSIEMYVTKDYLDAFDYFETRAHLINKKRKVFVKEVGTKHRHYGFDEKFYAELLARADVSSDEFYEEDTDNVSVQIHQPDKRHGIVRAIWRGAVRRDDGKQPIEPRTDNPFHPMKQRTFHKRDSVLDDDGGLD